MNAFDVFNVVPWVVAILGCWIWYKSVKNNKIKYAEFLRNSPGIKVDTSGIEYREGHGFKR